MGQQGASISEQLVDAVAGARIIYAMHDRQRDMAYARPTFPRPVVPLRAFTVPSAPASALASASASSTAPSPSPSAPSMSSSPMSSGGRPVATAFARCWRASVAVARRSARAAARIASKRVGAGVSAK